MVGEGMVEMDVALFMACCAACAVNIYYLPAWHRASKNMAFMRLLRVAGWLVISARFGTVLLTIGDIAISVPSSIGLFFLAAGEIVALFNRGKVGKL